MSNFEGPIWKWTFLELELYPSRNLHFWITPYKVGSRKFTLLDIYLRGSTEDGESSLGQGLRDPGPAWTKSEAAKIPDPEGGGTSLTVCTQVFAFSVHVAGPHC